MNVADTPISLSLAKRRDRSMLSNALVKLTYNRGHLGLLRESFTQAERSAPNNFQMGKIYKKWSGNGGTQNGYLFHSYCTITT